MIQKTYFAHNIEELSKVIMQVKEAKFLSGKDDKESVTSVLSLKPEGYILKSAGKEKLLEQIGAYFESKKVNMF